MRDASRWIAMIDQLVRDLIKNCRKATVEQGNDLRRLAGRPIPGIRAADHSISAGPANDCQRRQAQEAI